METVVVTAHRGTSMMSGATLLIVSVVLAATVALVLLRHFRHRHQPGA